MNDNAHFLRQSKYNLFSSPSGQHPLSVGANIVIGLLIFLIIFLFIKNFGRIMDFIFRRQKTRRPKD